MMKVSRGSKGFTLIELLIVVAIIGILAAIAIPAYTGYTAKARLSEVVNSMGAIKNAVMAYYTESTTGLPASITGGANIEATYGVNPPARYVSNWTVAFATPSATITAALQNINGVTGTLQLQGDITNQPTVWVWSGIPAQYLPKN